MIPVTLWTHLFLQPAKFLQSFWLQLMALPWPPFPPRENKQCESPGKTRQPESCTQKVLLLFCQDPAHLEYFQFCFSQLPQLLWESDNLHSTHADIKLRTLISLFTSYRICLISPKQNFKLLITQLLLFTEAPEPCWRQELEAVVGWLGANLHFVEAAASRKSSDDGISGLLSICPDYQGHANSRAISILSPGLPDLYVELTTKLGG